MTKQTKTSGAICGGVVSQSVFNRDPWGHMMAYIMEDKQYAKYVAEKDDKKREQMFEKFARSAI